MRSKGPPMADTTIMVVIPIPSQGLSARDVARLRGLIHEALVAIADTIEAAADFDCDPAVCHAIAAGLRGDEHPPSYS